MSIQKKAQSQIHIGVLGLPLILMSSMLSSETLTLIDVDPASFHPQWWWNTHIDESILSTFCAWNQLAQIIRSLIGLRAESWWISGLWLINWAKSLRFHISSKFSLVLTSILRWFVSLRLVIKMVSKISCGIALFLGPIDQSATW